MLNYNDRMKKVGSRIKVEREKMGLKPKEFLPKIYKSEKSHKMLTAWENGERMPDLDSLALMSELFNCDIGYLLGDYDEKTRTMTDICAATGLSSGSINAIRYMTANGKKTVLDHVIGNFHFFSILGLIYRLSQSKRKDDLQKIINNPFGDISENYVYEAVASNEATKLISDVSDELSKEANDG